MADKGLYIQSYKFSSSHLGMWELDHKIVRVLKNLCFQTVVLEKTLESPLDSKEIKLVNPNGYQSWIFTGRTNAKAEAPILWPPDVKNWLTGKDPDACEELTHWKRPWRLWRTDSLEKTLMLGKIEGRGRRGWQRMRWSDRNTDSMDVSLSKLLSDSEGQGSLACCSPWGHKMSDTTEWLNWTDFIYIIFCS